MRGTLKKLTATIAKKVGRITQMKEGAAAGVIRSRSGSMSRMRSSIKIKIRSGIRSRSKSGGTKQNEAHHQREPVEIMRSDEMRWQTNM